MKKALLFFVVIGVCGVLAFRHFYPDFSLFGEVSGDDSNNIADISQPMPRTIMPAVDGKWLNLESLKGKVVMISFWTTWCPGCRDEVPDLIKLQQEFEPQGFTVVAIAVDDGGEETVKSFVQKERFSVDGSSRAINFPVLVGDYESAGTIGYEGGLPASVLVSRDSQEVKIIRGPFKLREVSKAIKHLL